MRKHSSALLEQPMATPMGRLRSHAINYGTARRPCRRRLLIHGINYSTAHVTFIWHAMEQTTSEGTTHDTAHETLDMYVMACDVELPMGRA